MNKGRLLLSLVIASVMLLTSCEKEIVSTALVVDETQTATIKLYISAEFDSQNTENESVSGEEIIVSVSRNDLNPNFTGQGRWSTKVLINSGVVTVDVPASENGCAILLDIVDFEHSYINFSGESSTRIYDYQNSLFVMAGSSYIYSIVLSDYAI